MIVRLTIGTRRPVPFLLSTGLVPPLSVRGSSSVLVRTAVRSRYRWSCGRSRPDAAPPVQGHVAVTLQDRLFPPSTPWVAICSRR